MGVEPAHHGQRLWALLALVLLVAALALALIIAIRGFPDGISVLVCLVLALAAGWYGVRERGLRRVAGLSACALLIAGAVALIFIQGEPLLNALMLVCFVASVSAAKRAFAVRRRWPRASVPEHPVLFYNPRSGGGKAKRFHLDEEARRRGIEPIELRPGDDLERLVRTAVRHGADGLAVAGGDGSQAVVAQIAAELDLPYACIPAGTRNHFALDLGVDREDVVGALDAFVDGGERRVDLAEVNGRVFVNNVSLGLYANAVQEEGYREAKLRTLLDAVPDSLGPQVTSPQLHWQESDHQESGAVILVSNNPYRLGRALGSGTRPRIDGGKLGIAVVEAAGTVDGRPPKRPLTVRQWSDSVFEIDSEGSVPAGIDGEAVVLEPPLRFRSLPGALRVRIAPGHPGLSPSARQPDSAWETVRTVAEIALHG